MVDGCSVFKVCVWVIVDGGEVNKVVMVLLVKLFGVFKVSVKLLLGVMLWFK